MSNRSCLNCRWAKWQLTDHEPPRINSKRVGRCAYRVVLPVLPAMIDANEAQRWMDYRTNYGLWADNPYTDCAAWEVQKAEAKAKNERGYQSAV